MLKLRPFFLCRAAPQLLKTTPTSRFLNTADIVRNNNIKLCVPHASVLGIKTQRFYSTEIQKTVKNDSKLLIKDQERIYYGTLAPRMKAVKFFSLTTSLVGLMAQPILLEQSSKLGGTGMAVLVCGFAGFFTVVTPLLLHFITKKYVTEIYYNPKSEEYTAVTVSIILRTIFTKFKVDDVKVPEVPGMFTSFLVKDKPLFVDPALFDNPEHYVKMMGYDKPIDFKLNIPTDISKTETPNKSIEK